MPRIRVFLADDHAVLRAGLKALLSAQADIDVVGEAGDGLEALHEAERLRPDVVLADVGMPGLSGLELTHRLKESLPEARVLILTVHEDQSFLHRACGPGLRDTWSSARPRRTSWPGSGPLPAVRPFSSLR
jgi:DNA-binding NarL/FixJ family response regulator